MSVQRAAGWILDKYYSEFSFYNPYLDKLTLPRQRKMSAKMYDSDGQSGIQVHLQKISPYKNLIS